MTKCQIIPVIHVISQEQALRNADIAYEAECPGVMLIQMEGRNNELMEPAAAIKERWPDKKLGVNMLGMDPQEALNFTDGIEMTWTDNQPTHSHEGNDQTLDVIDVSLKLAGPNHEFFCGVAFKHQAYEPDPVGAAKRAIAHGYIPTTSGPATGKPADPASISYLRQSIGANAPLALASGITPENAKIFAPHVSHILVSTGISKSFYEFDADLVKQLMDMTGEFR